MQHVSAKYGQVTDSFAFIHDPEVKGLNPDQSNVVIRSASVQVRLLKKVSE